VKEWAIFELVTKNPIFAKKPNFFADDHDMEVLMKGMKIALEVGNSPAFKKYDAKLF
jgi:hypothetical protein